MQTGTEKRITLPLDSEKIAGLHAGDRILLSGSLYVARDAAHKRFHEALKNNQPLPFDPRGEVIYYMGPAPAPPGEVIGSAGPTTSHRMDAYTPELLDLGLAGMIGKGNRTAPVLDSIVKNGAVYMAAVGGAGALLQDRIQSVETVCYEDLGAEALRRIVVKDFPVTVVTDSYGNNLYETQTAKYAGTWNKMKR
ncbi:MAG: Fe-S-containing hydro-lyase [Eubacteriaceae bacterium]|jgi:fumarate hydratase subunit beta